jgi:hypothetical protein
MATAAANKSKSAPSQAPFASEGSAPNRKNNEAKDPAIKLPDKKKNTLDFDN